MHRPTIRLVLAVTAGLLLVAAGPAFGAPRDKIIMDCADDGRLQGDYSREELRDARQNLPSDVAEYTDCADVLRRAELAGAGGAAGGAGLGGGPGAAGGGIDLAQPLTPADDAERAELARAGERGGDAVDVGGATVVPGASGLSPQARTNGLPDTVLATLVLLGAAAAAALIPALRRSGLARLLPFRRR